MSYVKGWYVVFNSVIQVGGLTLSYVQTYTYPYNYGGLTMLFGIDPIALAILFGLSFAAVGGLLVVVMLRVITAYDLHMDDGDDF